MAQLSYSAGARADFIFNWAQENGSMPLTQDEQNHAFGDFLHISSQHEAIMNTLNGQLDTWRVQKGKELLSDSDLAQFDIETGLITKCQNDLSGITPIPHIADLCEKLSLAAVQFQCDDATAAALKSISALMSDLAAGRAALSQPTSWTDARLQANQIFQSEAIAGIPLHQAWNVALDKLEHKARQLLKNNENPSKTVNLATPLPVQGKSTKLTGNWLTPPLSKREIARRLKTSPKKLGWLEQYGLKLAGKSRQAWTLQLDLMPINERQKLENKGN